MNKMIKMMMMMMMMLNDNDFSFCKKKIVLFYRLVLRKKRCEGDFVSIFSHRRARTRATFLLS